MQQTEGSIYAVDDVAGEVWSDVELIWANCRLYNGEGSWVDDAAQKLQKETAAMWSAAGLPSAKRSSGAAQSGTFPCYIEGGDWPLQCCQLCQLSEYWMLAEAR